jgi:hypothetical protein
MKTMYLNKDPHATSSTDELLIGLVQSPLLPDITRQGTLRMTDKDSRC